MAEKIGKNMILINAPFGMSRSFKLIPVTLDCPYVECIFSTEDKILVIISKVMKQSYHMLPKLDSNGDGIPVKGKPRPNKKTIVEERRLVDTFSEFYLMTPEEISGFVHSFAINSKEFPFEDFMKEEEDPKSKLFVPEKPELVKEMPKE
jgi:hypothetical protein|tara:strand:+ start:620 stop:1066 length:447 start_codon:yes stop_codon:yes gene_type:complete